MPDVEEHAAWDDDLEREPNPDADTLHLAYDSVYTHEGDTREELLEEWVEASTNGKRWRCWNCHRQSQRFIQLRLPTLRTVVSLCDNCGSWTVWDAWRDLSNPRIFNFRRQLDDMDIASARELGPTGAPVPPRVQGNGADRRPADYAPTSQRPPFAPSSARPPSPAPDAGQNVTTAAPGVLTAEGATPAPSSGEAGSGAPSAAASAPSAPAAQPNAASFTSPAAAGPHSEPSSSAPQTPSTSLGQSLSDAETAVSSAAGLLTPGGESTAPIAPASASGASAPRRGRSRTSRAASGAVGEDVVSLPAAEASNGTADDEKRRRPRGARASSGDPDEPESKPTSTRSRTRKPAEPAEPASE